MISMTTFRPPAPTPKQHRAISVPGTSDFTLNVELGRKGKVIFFEMGTRLAQL